MDEQRKKVDESYKEKIEKEKVHPESVPQDAKGAQEKEEFTPPEPSFSFFVTTLAMQATIALGDVPDPQTNKPQQNLPQAKFLIDTLGVLQEKTRNNLTKEEGSLLEGMLYELRMQYVQKSNKDKTSAVKPA